MSLDFPFFEELKKRKHPAAKWWRLGDCLYYLGLLGAVGSVLAVPIVTACCLLFQWSWLYLLYSGLALLLFALVFVMGSLFKGMSYKMAEKDRIPIR